MKKLFLISLIFAPSLSHAMKTANDGVYKITKAEDKQTRDGSQSPLTQKFLAIVNRNFMGSKYVEIASCDSESSCKNFMKAKPGEFEGVHDFIIFFSGGNDSQGWKAQQPSAGSALDNEKMCDGSIEEAQLKFVDSGKVEFHHIEHGPIRFPLSADGWCGTDAPALQKIPANNKAREIKIQAVKL